MGQTKGVERLALDEVQFIGNAALHMGGEAVQNHAQAGQNRGIYIEDRKSVV